MYGRVRELALYRAAVLRDRGYSVITPETLEEATASIRKGGYDIAVLTYTLSNEVVQELAELIREYCPQCPLVVISSNKRMDREVRPDEMVDANEGPAALLAALHRASKPN
jgi:DNA-binding NtrC family response regulator